MKTLPILSVILILGLMSIQSFAQEKVKAGYGLAVVQTEPEFPGGTQALATYLRKEAHYPTESIGTGQRVKIYVGFVVDKMGKVKDAGIVTSSGNQELDAEALHIIQQMPNWNPGTTNGTTVERQVILPVELFPDKK